jgi:predicted PurR-regulated permease PerM
MNSKVRTTLLLFSGVFVLIGAALYLTLWLVASYLMAIGAAGVTIYYLTIPYQSLNHRLRRLHRINILAGIAMIAASVFMFRQQMEWVVCLLISALLQFYTSFAIRDKES